MLLSVSWYVTLRSYRQLNSAKFRTMHELEKELAFPLFAREWEFLRKDAYLRLTVVERLLPGIFFTASCWLVVWSACR